MNNYKDYIYVSKKFVPAVKIENHLNDTNKLGEYIPTKQSIAIIRNFCINRNGSNVIFGPYGSGKSHLVALLTNIMSNRYEIKDYKELSNRISNIDKETSELFNKRIEADDKRFVIIPPYNSRDFEQAMLIGITEALKREGYENIIIESSFYKVISEIRNWEEKFPETYLEFKNILETEYFINENNFIEEIKNFNKEYYEIFVDIYPKVTSGAEFFHYDNQNIVGILREVNSKMLEYGYTGTDIIFDEFGSFLENNIDIVNMALIQEIAEIANDNQNQISLYLITHKDLSQYGSRISNEVVIEWRKVEGRFRRFILEQSPTDIYEIISSVILKQEGFDEFFNVNKDKFVYMNERVLALPTFKELSEEEIFNYIVKGCFPLSPLSVFALYKLTNKVAQSNRTLFTFLISEDENSLGEFVRDNRGEFWLNGAMIYDYFEQSIWSESRESNLYKIWQEVNSGINKSDNKKVHIEIIKVIGLIYIINDFDRLQPSVEYISLLLPNYTEKEIEIALEKLVEKKIIIYRKIYGYYKFYEGSDLDLQEHINNIIEENKENICTVDILNQYFLPLPIIPRRHNDKYYMNRYMECRFIKASEINPKLAIKELENGFKDGIVYYVIPEDKGEIEGIIENRKDYKDIPNLIILLPRTTMVVENAILNYWAILNSLEDEKLLEKEHFLKNELLLYEEDVSNEIELILSRYFNNQFKNVYVINNGEILSDVNSRYELQKNVSYIMDNYYKNTIKINNEMVNKNKVTPTMKSVSRRVINKLWNSIENNNEIDFREFSAEDTLIRTVYINTGIIILDENNRVHIKYKDLPEDHNIMLIFKEMEKYIELCRQQEQSFYNLYKILKEEPYGIKDGLIPLLFSIAIINNLDNIYIKRNGVYEDLDGKLLIKMVEVPKDYLVSIDIWDDEKESYILELEDIFKNYIDYEYRNKNRLGSLYKGIIKYYIRLPKFTRETSFVSDNTHRIREIMSNEYLDYKDLFFNIFPGELCYDSTARIIKEAKGELDEFLINFEKDYSQKVATIFGDSENGIKNSIEASNKLNPEARNYMFDLRTNLFLKYVESPEEEYLRGLIKILTGFDLEYVTDEIVHEFIDDLIKIKAKLEHIENVEGGLNETIKIDMSFNNIKKTKYLDDIELSRMGELLENKIRKDINNFNYSIDEEEKAYILVKILKEIIQ